MFGFKHRLVKTGILKGKTDIHCHILPGVDDGSPDMPHSLDLLDYMEHDLGIAAAWLTPHVMEGMGNTAAKLEVQMQKLLSEYGGGMTLHLGSEYMMDSGFSTRLNTDALKIGKNHLLVETSYMNGPNDLYDILLSVWNKGLRPLIAHPERYMYMSADDYHNLKGLGYDFQLNLLSLSGYYGQRPRLVAENLLEEGLYDNVGTDLHHLDRFEDYLWDLRLTRRQTDAIEQLLDNNTRL